MTVRVQAPRIEKIDGIGESDGWWRMGIIGVGPCPFVLDFLSFLILLVFVPVLWLAFCMKVQASTRSLSCALLSALWAVIPEVQPQCRLQIYISITIAIQFEWSVSSTYLQRWVWRIPRVGRRC